MANGNTLGPRKAFKYLDDLGEEYRYFTDEDLGLTVEGELSTGNVPDLPRAFRPRGVYVVGKDNPSIKKFLVVGSPEGAIFKTNQSRDVEIDGVQFRTTGRRGEAKTFRGGGAAQPEGGGGGGE